MSEPADAVQAQLAKLRLKYGLALPEKISGLSAAFGTYFTGPWDEQACSTAHRQIHSLAGSSGTYGFPEISGIARAVEALIKQSLEARAPLPADPRARVDDLMTKLRELAADAARQVSA
jgi:HPt (histidine-containing phosphotransfer) domain-containing protein